MDDTWRWGRADPHSLQRTTSFASTGTNVPSPHSHRAGCRRELGVMGVKELGVGV